MSNPYEILKRAKQESLKKDKQKEAKKSKGDYKGELSPIEVNNILRSHIGRRVHQLTEEFNRLGYYLVPPIWLEGLVLDVKSKVYARNKRLISSLIELNVPLGGVISTKDGFEPKEIKFDIFTPEGTSQYLIEPWDFTIERFLTESQMSKDILLHFNNVWENMTNEDLANHLANLIRPRRKNVAWSDKGQLFIRSDSFSNFPQNKIRVDFEKEEIFYGQSHRVSPVLGVELEPPFLLKGRYALAFLLLGILSKSETAIFDPNTVTGYITRSSTLWLPQDNYGAKNDPNSLNGTVKLNVTKPVLIENTRGSYPPIRLKGVGGYDEIPLSSKEQLETFLNANIPATPDKYGQYRKGLKTGPGAEAMGIGIYTDEEGKKGEKGKKYLASVSADPEKSHKDLNRPGTFFGANIADSTENEKALLSFQTSEGTKHRIGIPINAVISNSCIGHGDGVAILNPNKYFTYSVDSVIKGEIPKTSIPPHLASKLSKQSLKISNDPSKLLIGLVDLVRSKAKERIDPNQVYSYGDTIFSFWKDKYSYPVVTLKKPNCHFRPYPIEDDDISYNYERDAITIRIRGQLVEYQEQDIKARGPGIKCTLHTEEIHNVESWDVLFPIGALKGRLALLFMWVESLGVPAIYNPHTCVLTFQKEVTQYGKSFKEVNLLEEDCPLEDWVERETKTIKFKRRVAKHILDYAYDKFPHHIQYPGENKPNADVVVLDHIQEHNRTMGYVIQESCQVLQGKFHINVEVSTPRENTGKHGLTLEQLLRIELLYPPLAKQIVKISQRLHKSVERLVGYNSGNIHLGEGDILTTEQVINKLGNKLDKVKNPKKGLFILSKIFPNGLILETDPCQGYYPFDLLATYGESIAGGLEESVVSLFKSLDKDPHIINEVNVTLNAQIMRWARGRMRDLASGRSKVLARLGKTGPVCGGSKAKTSHEPSIEPNGLPIAIIHPDDELVDLCNIQDGDIVLSGRNPLGSMAFFKVFLSKEHGCIAHIKISALISSAASESDGDGDPIFLLPVNKLSRKGMLIDEKLAISLNESTLCLGGYKQVHSEEPFEDFISFNNKWGSKILNYKSPSPLVTPKKPKPIPVLKPIEEVLKLTEKTCEHYTYGVGRGYNLYSALVMLMANQKSLEYKKFQSKTVSHITSDDENIDNTENINNTVVSERNLTEVEKLEYLEANKDLKALELAMVLAERIFYEDFGLGGYKPKSSALLTLVDTIARYGTARVLKTDEGSYHRLDDSTSLNEEGVSFTIIDGIEELALTTLGSISKEAKLTIGHLLDAQSVVIYYNQIESRENQPIEDTPDFRKAVLCGAARRLGQGNTRPDASGISTLSLAFGYIQAGLIDSLVSSDTLKSILKRGATVTSLAIQWHETQQNMIR
jgi:hypothetical protein